MPSTTDDRDSNTTSASPGDAAEPDVAVTVRNARDVVADLACEDGAFVVVGKETGVSPDPVSAVAFETYAAAERARDAAARYRAAMRDLDPGLPTFDLVACERQSGTVELATVRESTTERRGNGLPQARQTVTATGDRRDEWLRVENAPLVHLAGPESLLDDALVTRQLRSKL
jgi:hypothetical protein